MEKLVTVGKSPARIPDEIADFFTNPPLWRGESREQYLDLLLAIASSVGAVDVVPWLLVGELTYHTWEIRRLQRIAAELVLGHQVETIEQLLKSTYDPKDAYSDMLYAVSDARNEARKWVTDLEFAKKLDERLATRGHDRASILARAYARCASELQEIDRGITNRELRRKATLREISRCDEVSAKRLERRSLEVIEGEFSEAAE